MPKAVGIDLGTTKIAAMAGGQPAVVANTQGSRTAPGGAALVLRKLAEDASKVLGERVTQAVITVPASGTDAQRRAARDAGQTAGLEVLGLITEPTAAAIAYGLDRREQQKVLVLDLGGGTFDVSVLDVGDGVIEVRATAGDTQLGGDDFDRRLVDHIAGEFHREQGIDLRADPQARQRLVEAAERAKVELSSLTQTQVNLPSVTADASGPKHLTTTVTRSTFERICADLVERCRGPARQAMGDARISSNDLNEVIGVGGATRMPAVQALVRHLTGGKDANMTMNPDEVVAMGAAIQAGRLAGGGAVLAGGGAEGIPDVRDVTGAGNQLESLAVQLERRLAELGETAAAHERVRAQMLIDEARDAVQGEAQLDRLRGMSAELQQVGQALLVEATRAGPASGVGTASTGQHRSQPVNERADDVIDEDVTPR